MMQAKVNELVELLKATKRTQAVNGKPQDQVPSCLIFHDEEMGMRTTSLVKDGKTSVSTFRRDATSSGEGTVAVADIDRLLGILSMHGPTVKIESHDGKIVVKSSGKQTTLSGGDSSMAFPHSDESLLEWATKSAEVSKSINAEEGKYLMRDGAVLESIWKARVSANDLFEAFRCDNINSQKLNLYTIEFEHDGLVVSVGEDEDRFGM